MKLIKIATDFENQFSEQQKSKTEEKKFVCVEISTKIIVYMQFYDKVVLSFFVSIPIDITRPRTAHISDCSRMTLNYELY